MTMKRTLVVLASLALASCTAAVSDLNGFHDFSDACDPRGAPHLGEDLDIQFLGTIAHVNEDMRFAIEVGADHQAQAMFVISTFDDPNMQILVPEVLPAEPSTLAFWADSNMDGTFAPLNIDMVCSAITSQTPCGTTAHCMWNGSACMASVPPSHQWTRPICPNGRMTFTHTTPFQDVSIVTAAGAVFAFHVPMSIQRHEVFDNYRIAMWAVQTNSTVGRQTRAYYQWNPQVPIGGIAPTQRTPPTVFQIGKNVAGELRGPIDQGDTYEINFIIDSNRNGDFEVDADYACRWTMQPSPQSSFMWDYMADITAAGACDPHGFDPTTVTH
jgi:hypothetical protein